MEGFIGLGAFVLLFLAFVIVPTKLMKRRENED